MTRRLTHGFTLIELIMVVILIGILSAYLVPRINFDLFDAHVDARDLTHAIRYAQARSMSGGGADPFSIHITTTGYEVKQGAASVIDPTTGSTPYIKTGVEIDTTAVLCFSHYGRPLDAACLNPMSSALTVQVTSGGQSMAVTIEPDTGYAWIQ